MNDSCFRHMAAAEARDAIEKNIQTIFKEQFSQLFAALRMPMLIVRKGYKV